MLVLALGIGTGLAVVKADYDSYQTEKVINVAGNFIESPQLPQSAPESVSEPEERLGAVVAADSLPARLCQNGLCSHVIQQTFIDASTTIISIPAPFQKATTTYSSEVVLRTDDGGQKWTAITSTVDLASLRITGAATTSYRLACAASATAGAILPFYDSLVTTSIYGIATSSIGLMENDLTQLQGAIVDGGTVSKITLHSAKPWLVCAVESSVAAGFTNALNTFAGEGTFRFNFARY